MQPCADLKNLIVPLYEKEVSGKLFDFAKQLYSSQDGVIVIGSDPADWYKDYQEIIRLYASTNAAVLEIRKKEINAYCENAVGWVMDRVLAKLSNGIEVPFRNTHIFHQENDAWKIVHTHISIGISDESLGV